MRAAEIRAPGDAPVVTDRPAPAAADGEVLVDVLAAPIMPLDVLCATGTSYFGVPATPYVPGVMGVGTDPGGRPVWFPTAAGMAPGDGAMAQTVAVPAGDLVPVPDDADPVALAAAGLSAVAALMALTWRGGLAAGERVLVLGAGGAVGQAGVALARAAGAGKVIAAARSASGRERAAEAGADTVVALDTDDLDVLAGRFAGEGPVDLVLDPLFGAPAVAATRALVPGGRLVNLGSSAGPTAPFESTTLRSRSLRVLGYTNNELTADQRRGAVEHVAEAVAAGTLRVAHEAVPLEEVTTVWKRPTGVRTVLRMRAP